MTFAIASISFYLSMLVLQQSQFAWVNSLQKIEGFLFFLQKFQELENKYDQNMGKRSLSANEVQGGENDK